MGFSSLFSSFRKSPFFGKSYSFRKSICLNRDIYSNGQIESKLWLCQQVEKLLHNQGPQTIWILGGWLGMLSFLLLSREGLNIKKICSFDQDPDCEKLAPIINNNWSWKNPIFKAKTLDCNKLRYTDLDFSEMGEPSLIINTSVEHFDTDQWYSNIPKGKKIVLQSCDMKHKEHVRLIYSEKEFQKKFPGTKLYYSGSLKFNYPSNPFTRFMLIFEK